MSTLTDFVIISRPEKIAFDCPHCAEKVYIPWSKLEPPHYWGDQWPAVDCPECGKTVELGTYSDYD